MSSAKLHFIELREQVEAHYNWRGGFPADNKDLGLPPAELLQSQYIKRTEVESGAIHFTFGNEAPEEIQGHIISFLPLLSQQASARIISWCAGEGCAFARKENASEEKVKKLHRVHGINRTTERQEK